MRFHAKAFAPGAVFDSFLGILDIKTGARIILLFAVLNKIAGVYGLLAAFSGGTIIQLSYYLYSTATLGILVWGLGVVSSESSTPTLILSHLYILDHLLQTLYTLTFAHTYWALPHDGHRVINSQAQQDLIDLATSRGEISIPSTGHGHVGEGEMERLAKGLWEQEKGTVMIVLMGAWLVKIYFSLVLYSYAAHLRSRTYHSLPLSSSSPDPNSISTTDQYASTAPERPSTTPYDNGLESDDVRIIGGEAEEDFAWESDEEGGKEKQSRNSREDAKGEDDEV